MGLKEVFKRFKNYTTDLNPDIFWPWVGVGWGCILLVFVMCITHLIVIYLKSKGLL